MELADMQDLGSCGAARVGSTPTFRTGFFVHLLKLWLRRIEAETILIQ